MSGVPLSEVTLERNRMTYGFGVGGMMGGIFGIEFDLGYTHKFYSTEGDVGANGNLLTAMPALVIGIPIGGQSGGGVRPYFVAGAGLMRRDVDFDTLDSITENDWGYTLGGGLMIHFNDSFGIRGDVRYLRNFKADVFDSDRPRVRARHVQLRARDRRGAVPVLTAADRPGRAHGGPPAACPPRPLKAPPAGSRTFSARRFFQLCRFWLPGVGLAGCLGFAAGVSGAP